MNNPFAKIFLATMKRIQEQVPEILHIDQDIGQLQGYDKRPAVAFPLTLIDFQGWAFTEMGQLAQQAEGDVIVTLGFAIYSPSSEKVTDAYREVALQYYELEWKLFRALHGWSPGDEFGYLTRRGTDTQNLPGPIRIRTMRFRNSFEDYSARPSQTITPKPPLEVNGENV